MITLLFISFYQLIRTVNAKHQVAFQKGAVLLGTGLLLYILSPANGENSLAPVPYVVPPPPTATPAPPPIVPTIAGSPPVTPPPQSSPPPISLTIYYDAMETTSQTFFNSSFNKDFPVVSTFIDLHLRPCQLVKEYNGDLSCPAKADPHCTLDKVHYCAVTQTVDTIKLASYLACTMSSMEKLPDFVACANEAKLDNQIIQACAKSDQSKILCDDYGRKSSPGSSKIMPKFIFKSSNDISSIDPFEFFDMYINRLCTSDFLLTICAQLKVLHAKGIPKECNQKLILGVFYKAMGPKSQKWIQSFAKVYDKFSDYLVIKFSPCMFAEYVDGGKLDCGETSDTDCVASKTHACAITLIQDPKVLFQFLKCVTQDSTKLPDFEKCAKDNNIDYDAIKSCAESDKGKNLCHNFSKIRPRAAIRFPVFSYGVTFDEKLSADTATANDLQPVFCNMLKKFNVRLPPDCQ